MNVQELGAIGEFVSSIAIVITLIFLAVETRRARNTTQQSTRQARQRIRTDLSLAVAVNPQLSEAFTKTFLDVDPEVVPIASEFGLSTAEGFQVYNYTLAYYRYLEDQFFSDLPETDRFALEAQVKVIPSNRYFAKFWEQSKEMFDHRFQGYVDNLIE